MGVTTGPERTSARASSHHLQVKDTHGRIYRTNLYNCGLWAPTTRYHGSQSNYAYLKRNANAVGIHLSRLPRDAERRLE